jgi:cysteine-rich repeat protein
MFHPSGCTGLVRAAVVVVLSVAIFPAMGTGTAAAQCGNGVLDAGERCDDHNTRDDDYCSSSCVLIECTIQPSSVVGWEEMGPFSVGGRVTALALDPQDPMRALVGSPAGGIWRTGDGGSTWQAVTPWLAATPISALAIHPTDPGVVVAGTGSIDDGGSVGPGIGIIRSPDGGDSWWQVTLGQVVPYVSSLLFWAEEPDRLLAGCDLGVLRSFDGGETFDFVLQGQAVSDLVRDPADGDTVLAPARSGLFVSRDRGDTWERASSWPLLESDEQGAGTAAVAVSHLTPGLLFAVVQVFAAFNETDRALLLRSADGGETFDELDPPAGLCGEGASCGYGLALAIHPDDDDLLLLGGDRLFRSADGGASWAELTDQAAKVHEIRVHPGGALIGAATGVAAVGPTWTGAVPRNDGLAITGVLSLDASAETEPRLLAGTTDTGTILGVGGAAPWQIVFAPSERTGTARFDPFDGDRLFASRPHGRFHRSDDGGQSFSPIQDGLDLGQASAAITPFEPSTLVPDLLFTGLLQPFESTDGGDSWHEFRPEGFPEVSTIAASQVDPDRVYFALSSGATLFKADDIHTEALPITGEPNHRITSVFLDPAAENVVYAALSNTASQTGRIFKSWNFGVDWQDISPPGLPATTSIVKDAFGALYVGNAEGVWRSANDGFSWARFQSGLLGSAVSTLRLGRDRIYAGTPGRGVYSMPVVGLTSIESIPTGQLFWVDGELVRTPHFVLWPPGSTHTVEPYLLQTGSSRQVFGSWSDGGGFAHEVVAGDGSTAITAAIRNLFRLDLATDPPGGGSVAIDPPTVDRFFFENQVVSWVAVPAPDHRFTGFTGNPSGGQGGYGFAVMDRPRSVVAHFEPLSLTITTDPPGLSLLVDGRRIVTPRTYGWAAGSVHSLSADELVDLDPADPAVLAFDRWSDLFDREHDFTMRRDTFVTSLEARYVTIVPELEVPERGARSLRTGGRRAAPRYAVLTIDGGPTEAPPSLQIIRGEIEDEIVTELALAPGGRRYDVDVVVEGGTGIGRTRLAIHNPGTEEARVDLLLRDRDGLPLVARDGVLRVAPGGRAVGVLEELVHLADPYEGLLSLISDQPIVASIQAVRSNVRPSTFLDPILVIPHLEADRGVPDDVELQALLLTPDTVHRLVLANPGGGRLTGTIEIVDEQGSPLALAGGQPASRTYDVPAGGFDVIGFSAASPGGPGVPVSARIHLRPGTGQAPPLVQLVEEQTVDSGLGSPIALPRSIPPSQLAMSFVLPVDLARRDTGAVLTNPSPSAGVTLTVELLDEAGDAVDTTTVDLAADRQRLALAGELFPGAPSSLRGSILVTSSAPIFAVGVLRLVNGRGEQILAGFPVPGAEPPDPNGGPSAVYPYAVDGDSWSSEWWQLGAMSSGATTVSLKFTGEQGAPLHLPMEWP